MNFPLADGVTPTYSPLVKKWMKEIMYGRESVQGHEAESCEHEWGVVVDEVEAL